MPKPWLTPPQLAEEWSVDCKKVLAFIATGELVAVNFAQRSNERPRWKVSRESIDQFLSRRQSRPPAPRAIRSRKKAANVVEFY
jgi:hypothetical protein